MQELKGLTRDQNSWIQSQTRLAKGLTACLKAYYPVALKLTTSLHHRSTLHFLQTYPTPEVALAASQDQITELLKNAGHPQAKAVAAKIVQTLHQPHLMADVITTRCIARLMQALIKQLLPLLEEIAVYDKEIKRLFLTHEDHEIFSGLPRAGKRLAPRLKDSIGDDRTRYAQTASLQALASTEPLPYESGTYSKPHRRYACIKPKRLALQQFAWQSTQSEPWARAYYQRKCQEGKSHSEGRASTCQYLGQNHLCDLEQA